MGADHTTSPLATLTHARLRIAQGDIQGARALLREIVERGGESTEAERLLHEIEGRPDRARTEKGPRPLPPPEAADAAELGEDFRRILSEPAGGRRAKIERLERWLSRIGRRSGLV
jgi:FimV-like protein